MCFICGLEDHIFANFPKPDTLDNKFHWKTEKPKNCSYRSTKIDKAPENGTDQSKSQKMNASMTYISSNVESPRGYFVDSSQPTNWILDSGTTCHMKPKVSGCVLGSLV